MRYLLALAFVVSLGVPAFAQGPESRVILSQLTERERDGVVTIPTATLPALTQVEITNRPVNDELLCKVVMPTAVYENPATKLTVSLYKFDAPGFWRRMGSATFVGGHYVDEDGNVNPPFTMSVTSGGIRGREVRCEIETQRPVVFAVDVEHYTVARAQ